MAHDVKFKVDLNAPFYIKYGKRVKTKGINALKPNNRINHRTVNKDKWKDGASDQKV